MQTLAEATGFVQDLKLGHYIKVPPRATFLGKSTDSPPYPDLTGRFSPICWHDHGIVRPSRRQTVDVRPRSGYLSTKPSKLPNMPAKPSILYSIGGLVSTLFFSPPFHLTLYLGDSSDRRDNLEKGPCITPNCTPSLSARSYLFRSGSGSDVTQTLGSSLSAPPSCSTA